MALISAQGSKIGDDYRYFLKGRGIDVDVDLPPTPANEQSSSTQDENTKQEDSAYWSSFSFPHLFPFLRHHCSSDELKFIPISIISSPNPAGRGGKGLALRTARMADSS
ncbi:MAG: hypothetical protein A4E66_02054 [Syntrophus sp. PtaB.Bin001]|nr:MAG: hypothetical protein A4E66_02054 [Syntrophus sp. PtaB.Bin001]